QMNSLRAEDTA
nr:immunoglobulin heavy chain junction region [Homo sapiens]